MLKMESQSGGKLTANRHSNSNNKDEKLMRKSTNFQNQKKKEKYARKRSQSFSGLNINKFNVPYKCRSKRPMLPTKFLLGGNICDPLNLNSLQDEEINRTVNAVTPKSSPVPTPPQRRGHIEVIIPPNIHDPLNLTGGADDAEYEQQLTSPFKKGAAAKRRKKKRRTCSTTSTTDPNPSEARTPENIQDSAKIPEDEIVIVTTTPTPAASATSTTTTAPTNTDHSTSNPTKTDDAVVPPAAPPSALDKTDLILDLPLPLGPKDSRKRKSDQQQQQKDNLMKIKMKRFESMDKIVSPVVPQPGAWLKRTAGRASSYNNNNKKLKGSTKVAELKLPHFKDKNKAYQFGNYNRYYGYRNPNHDVDPRLRCFAAHRYIFQGKDILDIGCNIGHITLSVARDFAAKTVVGIDIDKKLIGIARKNIRHYVNCNDSPRPEPDAEIKLDKSDKFFPISMPIIYGPVDIPGMQNEEKKARGFPHNVTFVQGNYVLDDDTLLTSEQPQFDVILCLSITKWLHLNWGDVGLKQAFRRMYAQLRPGGKLILEPQNWASYKHKKNLTELIYKNYHHIEFFPEKFTQYLLSSEVGFAKAEIMGHPYHNSKGFQRPIQVFTKSDLSPSQSQRSYTSITPSYPSKSQVYTQLPSPCVPSGSSSCSYTNTDANEFDPIDKMLKTDCKNTNKRKIQNTEKIDTPQDVT